MSGGHVYGMPLPPEREKELIEKIARWTVEHKLELPAVLFLQSLKPMSSYLSAMGYFYGAAFMGLLPAAAQYGNEALSLFDNPENVDGILQRIEELNQEQQRIGEERRKIDSTAKSGRGFFNRIKKIF